MVSYPHALAHAVPLPGLPFKIFLGGWIFPQIRLLSLLLPFTFTLHPPHQPPLPSLPTPPTPSPSHAKLRAHTTRVIFPHSTYNFYFSIYILIKMMGILLANIDGALLLYYPTLSLHFTFFLLILTKTLQVRFTYYSCFPDLTCMLSHV